MSSWFNNANPFGTITTQAGAAAPNENSGGYTTMPQVPQVPQAFADATQQMPQAFSDARQVLIDRGNAAAQTIPLDHMGAALQYHQSAAAAAMAPALQYHQSALARVRDRVNQGTVDAVGIGKELSGFVHEKMDLDALRAAGFGATGLDLERRKQEAYDALFLLSGPVRTRMLLALREMLKEKALADPDMWRCVKDPTTRAIDLFWDDVITYEEMNVEYMRLATTRNVESDHDGLATLGFEPAIGSPFWLRAHLLYHYLPFDKSIFGQLKDPLFIILSIIACVPSYAIRVVFFLLLLVLIVRGCPPDTFQLVGYILQIKGSQTLCGVFMSIQVMGQYWMCVHSNERHTCNTNGPGVDVSLVFSAIDFLGNCLLVWAAFFCLPCSAHSAGTRDVGADGDDEDDVHSEGTEYTRHGQSDSDGELVKPKPSFCSCCKRCRTRNPQAGGRLASLLCWDLLSFFLCCGFLVIVAYIDESHLRPGGEPAEPLTLEQPAGNSTPSLLAGVQDTVVSDMTNWQFRTAFYFTRIFYAYMSLPFSFFMIPLLNGILTHTTPTGYNRRGLCVPYMLPPLAKKTV